MPSLRFLFDSVISPILLYGSEIWGYQKSDVIEKVHINACKKFLGVSNNMCNSAVLGECGLFANVCFSSCAMYKILV